MCRFEGKRISVGLTGGHSAPRVTKDGSFIGHTGENLVIEYSWEISPNLQTNEIKLVHYPKARVLKTVKGL